jgi:mRNA-degrading endonuclease RelE of RelBE toxin-antitoxin system
MPYEIRFLDDAEEHLKHLTARERSIVLDAIVQRLVQEPTAPTRNRARMRENELAQYRLRVSHLRVYYDVDESRDLVVINAIGIKVREKVFVGGEEIDL